MITEIQADNLDEHRVRDLNDQINKKMRLKRAWEHRIVELGGPNYLGVHPTQFVDAGVAPDLKGGAYRYYGSAKKLPGVQELLQNAKDGDRKAKRSLEQITRSVTLSYYGYLDEDDGMLQQLEAEAEKAAMDETERELKNPGQAKDGEADAAKQKTTTTARQTKMAKVDSAAASETKPFISHVALPSKEEIEALIVERRKRELLKMYATPELQEQLEKDKVVVQTTKK